MQCMVIVTIETHDFLTVQDVAEPPPNQAEGKACNSSLAKVCYISDVSIVLLNKL